MKEEELFWAEKKAREIVERKRYSFIQKNVPEFKEFVIKSSASISGVLHIGRLSDTIRGDIVVSALKDMGYDAKLVWVAEDMDPLRKIPEQVPKEFEEHIGRPVSMIPDPYGCHKSYSQHFVEEYLEVMNEFLRNEPEIYFMSQEYRKGSFKEVIKKYVENVEKIRKILKKDDWLPFLIVCENCGRIITTRIIKIENFKAYYVCKDYKFEEYLAKGCGYEGEVYLLNAIGKIPWKGEWAAQWYRWKVVAEGAGKEYIVPDSAFWLNARICEEILDYPSPIPIFYEHIMIEGKKMSASVGNVVYPREWLRVAEPEVLRYLYAKKLMKARNFNWRDLPKLYDEYDRAAAVYYGKISLDDKKEEYNLKKLYYYSQTKHIKPYVNVPYSHLIMLVQIFERIDSIILSLKRSGHYNEELKEYILKRIELAKNYVEEFIPNDKRISIVKSPEIVKDKLSENQRKFLKEFAKWLDSNRNASIQEIHDSIYEIARRVGINQKEAFSAIYISLLNRNFGPRAASLIASLDRDFVVNHFKEVSGNV